MAKLYSNVILSLTELVNYSRFSSPLISWLIVTYVYFTIGIRTKENLWKLLYITCSNGILANLFYGIWIVSNNLKFNYYEMYIYLKYPEHFFTALNEWGLIYITFVKIRSHIKTLESKKWRIFINILLIYYVCFQILIVNDIIRYNSDRPKKFSYFLYIPVGFLETYFIFLIVISTINDDKDESKNILSILLHSSLIRMLIVSFILVGNSIIECVERERGYGLLIKRIFFRLKGFLGIIFLIDFLLVRINLNSNTIRENEIKLLKYCVREKNYEFNDDEKGESDTIGLDVEDLYGLNKTNKTPPMDHTQPSNVISKINSNIDTNSNSPSSNYNTNKNVFRNSSISEYNTNKNVFRNSSISEFNTNKNVFRNSSIPESNTNKNVFRNGSIPESNTNKNVFRNSSIPESNTNKNVFRNSSISEYNTNKNVFRNSSISEYNNYKNTLKSSPISERNKDLSLLIPKETNTPMISNIVTPYTNDIYSPRIYFNKNNRNSYKKLSNNYSIPSNNKNNGDIKISPTFSYTNPEL